MMTKCVYLLWYPKRRFSDWLNIKNKNHEMIWSSAVGYVSIQLQIHVRKIVWSMACWQVLIYIRVTDHKTLVFCWYDALGYFSNKAEI